MERKEEFEALGLQIKNLEEEKKVLSEKQLELRKQRRILFNAEVEARYSLRVRSIVEREGKNFVVVSIEIDRDFFEFPCLPAIYVNRILKNGRESAHRDYFASNYKVVAPSSVVQNGVVVFGEWKKLGVENENLECK